MSDEKKKDEEGIGCPQAVGEQGEEGEPGEDPTIEVELEEEEQPAQETLPEDEQEPCIQGDNEAADCSDCDRAGTCSLPNPRRQGTLTCEPATHDVPTRICVDTNRALPPDVMQAHLINPMTESAYRALIDNFKLTIMNAININPTKSLEVCAASVIYVQMMSLPGGLIAAQIIQVYSELLAAYKELMLEGGLQSTESTPMGVKVN